MRLQLRTLSLFLTLTSTVLAAWPSVSSTEGVAGAIVGTLGGDDGRQAADNGSVPLRRSITELAAEAGPQWHLYLQALRAMYDRDPKDPESFFQIAGIHGRPFTEYNNAGKSNTNGWSGYSTHGEVLFLIWHRAFIALFEQTLVKEAKILAAQYPDNLRPIYQRAAEDLRAPYWDWALEPWLPSAVLPETIEVKAATETGTVAKNIDNPLFTYRFSKEVLEGNYGEFNTYSRTYRCADPEEANQKLYSRNYKTWVFDVFVRAKSFFEFATTASQGSSLEAVHNAIHWDASCGDQFLSSEYAAFEPLFMLHHANVDRLWAYWQAIYPQASTFNGRYQGLSRFNTPSGTMISLDSPLQPFRQADGEWHTPRSVNSIKTFGYAYQGLEGYWNKSEAEVRQSAVDLILSLYGPEEKERPSVSSTSAEPTRTNSKQSVQTSSSGSSNTQSTTLSNGTASTMMDNQHSTQNSSVQSTTLSSGAASTMMDNQHSTQNSSGQSTQSHAKQTSSSVLSPSLQSPDVVGNRTNSAWPTAGASKPTPISSWRAGNETLVASSATSAALPTTSSQVDVHFGSNATGDYVHLYAGITVDVAHLPVRPCAIEISIDMWRAGYMAIMQMPERGILYDSISLSDAIVNAGLGDIANDEVLSQVISRLHVILRKADGSTIDVTQIAGLRVDFEEAKVVAATSKFELPQIVKSSTHAMLDNPVSGCAAPPTQKLA